jgi:hypothetical protein
MNTTDIAAPFEGLTVQDLADRFLTIGLPLANMDVWEALQAAPVKGAVYLLAAEMALAIAKQQHAANTPTVIVLSSFDRKGRPVVMTVPEDN